ncbi:MAG: hypothetical protein WD690_01220 [Vicinamibacterales bacterium]
MRTGSARGFSLIETLIALGLTASVSAALLPALAAAARLHRDSAIETEKTIVAAARMEWLAAAVADGTVGIGGRLDDAPGGVQGSPPGTDGWHAFVDRAGMPVEAGRASFESRWQVAALTAAPGVYVLAVRVIPTAAPAAAITLTLVVPDG